MGSSGGIECVGIWDVRLDSCLGEPVIYALWLSDEE